MGTMGSETCLALDVSQRVLNRSAARFDLAAASTLEPSDLVSELGDEGGRCGAASIELSPANLHLRAHLLLGAAQRLGRG